MCLGFVWACPFSQDLHHFLLCNFFQCVFNLESLVSGRKFYLKLLWFAQQEKCNEFWDLTQKKQLGGSRCCQYRGDLSCYSWMRLWLQFCLSLQYDKTCTQNDEPFLEMTWPFNFSSFLKNLYLNTTSLIEQTNFKRLREKKKTCTVSYQLLDLLQRITKSVRNTGFVSLILVLFCVLLGWNMLSPGFYYWRQIIKIYFSCCRIFTSIPNKTLNTNPYFKEFQISMLKSCSDHKLRLLNVLV